MRKVAPALILLLVVSSLAFAEPRVWNIETLRDKRLLAEWIDLVCSVIEKKPEALDTFAKKVTSEVDEHIVFLVPPQSPGVVGASRHLILIRELDNFTRLAKNYLEKNSLEPRLLEELRFMLVDHVVELLSQNQYNIPIDRVLDFLGREDHDMRILGLIMTCRIYSAELDLARNTLARIGDLRAYNKLMEFSFLSTADPSVRYWAVKISGLYSHEDAFKNVATAFRDPSEIVRSAAYQTLMRQTDPDAAKAQAGVLLLARFRELLDAIGTDNANAELNREAVNVDETLIELFRRDIGEVTGDDGRNGWGEIIAPTVPEYVSLSKKWFSWWETSKYAKLKAPVKLPAASEVPPIGAAFQPSSVE
ncbi:MAG: HEAT repeat domain-containing protein [Planctomycetota bacterium]